MRRSVAVAAVAALLTFGLAPQGRAEPPPDPRTRATAQLPSGWARVGNALTWTSSTAVPVGDAAIEFYAGRRLLGRPVPSRDGRTFRLDLDGQRTDLSELQVRAAGRRLDEQGGQAARRDRIQSAPRQAAEQPAATVDPGTAGPYETVTGEYTLDNVSLPGLPAAVEMKGIVVAPKGAPGRRPLALFLHGRHQPCFGKPEVDQAVVWPCPQGTQPVPSYRGYLQAQQLLASQGYDTVSISANAISAQDGVLADNGTQARSSLVRLHLGQWARWAGDERATAPEVVREAPPADLSRTLLVGHSRGGEGVNRAAMDSLSPPPADVEGYPGTVRWTIRGMLLIAPTAFGQNPAPGIPAVTILPGCDGDVADLQGQMYVDGVRGLEQGTALHSAIYVEGANHNYFNTEWTPGQAQAPAQDDAGNPWDTACAPTLPVRLSPARQQAVGATYAAAAAQLFVDGDDRVRPLLDGSGAVAPSARPAVVHAHAVGGTRRQVVLPDANTKVGGNGARLCAALALEQPCIPERDYYFPSPHFASFGVRSEEGRYAVDARWSAPGTPISVQATDAVQVTADDELALRIIVPPNTTGTTVKVAVTNTAGDRSAAQVVTIAGLPGSNRTLSYWGQEVRVPLDGFSGSIATLELTPTSDAGELWLLDAWTWRPGTPEPATTAAPPRVDLGLLQVDEGDSGTRTYDIPVRVTGQGAGTVRLFLIDRSSGVVTTRVVGFQPGQTSIEVPVPVTGNPRYSDDVIHDLEVKAVTRSMVGSHLGRLVVRNDDPMPEITFTPVTDHIKEGGTLDWRIHLSATADSDIYFKFDSQAPASGPELSTTDVDPHWLKYDIGQDPEPSRPLSSARLQSWNLVEAGAVTVDLTVPTAADDVPEPERFVQFQAEVFRDDAYAPIGTLTGSVIDS